MNRLFTPLKIREVEFKNRIFMAPMCQYSCTDGVTNDWHLVHYGTRACGGSALLIAEASAVSPEGRISPDDAGIWDDKHIEGWSRITEFIKKLDCIPGIQIAHAGRKASIYAEWKGKNSLPLNEGGWETLAPSAIPFSELYAVPRELTVPEIKNLIIKFADGAARAIKAGFEVIEIHMAHGYLVHEFLSPISNKRTDDYGGSLENRCRFAVETAAAVREAVPQNLPLFTRISATDWVAGGWDVAQSVELVKKLKLAGVDFLDCSTAGNVYNAQIPIGPGYQVPFAEKIKEETGILTGAVGLITKPEQAENIIASGQADAILLGKELLRNPYWPLQAAKKLNEETKWPKQYLRAK